MKIVDFGIAKLSGIKDKADDECESGGDAVKELLSVWSEDGSREVLTAAELGYDINEGEDNG